MKSATISSFLPIVLALALLAGCTSAATPTAQPTATAVQPEATVEATVEPSLEPTVEATVEPTVEPTATEEVAAEEPVAAADTTSAATLAFDNSAWNYDAENDVYWQIGVQYVANPETTEYETLGIYVPGAYLTAKANDDGTYTVTPNEQGAINGFTAATAPIVLPVNTPGYSASAAPTEYSYDELSSYLSAGFIYVSPGARGRANGYDDAGNLLYSGGAPWGVTDFKAAIRYIRYNQGVLPGDADQLFVFGMSGGGAQSSLIGATGDSELYYPYLEAIGAAMVDADGQPISDAVAGVMAWCPITSLDTANEAYEWNMGQYSTTDTRAESTWTFALSQDLATAYAEYINQLGIQDENGNVLVLEASESGVYAAGSYYDYLVQTVEESLNNFLVDTTFPYTESTGGGFGAPGGGMRGGTPPTGEMPGGDAPVADAITDTTTVTEAGAETGTEAVTETGAITDTATVTETDSAFTSASTSATTYQTAQEYIDALNADGEWVTYDAATNTAAITSLAGFVNSEKNPSKSVGAFDDLNRSQGENDLFGNDASDSLHFDATMAALLAENLDTYAQYADWDAAYVEAYATDLQALDKLGNSIESRVNMYNPMYYLLPYYAGYQTADVATHWRINTGIMQGDTATTVEMNLALALENYDGVEDVEFTTVWGQGHTTAERTGDSTSNFIAWVTELAQQ